MLKVPGQIVTVDWLYKNLENPNLIVLDGSINKVINSNVDTEKPVFIKNAQFFDIKKVFSIIDAPFPNTMLSSEEFQEKARNLGVNNNSCIVVYDKYGYYSCARVWWMFKSMGFDNIALLDGGLSEWKNAGYPTQNQFRSSSSLGDFKAKFRDGMIHNHVPVLDAIKKSDTTIVDARGNSRFSALVEEPRAGLRSGHIPSSKNIPYTSLLNGTKLKLKEELVTIFSKVHNDHVIFTCGSGITACILALGAEIAGLKSISVYDGSWTEWGSLTELPIEK